MASRVSGGYPQRPRNVTPAFAHELALLGVTRVSFGVQDFDPSVQQAIGRVQPFDLVAASVRNIRQAGISSLSFDLMYGLPHQTIDSAIKTAEQAITLQPDLSEAWAAMAMGSISAQQAPRQERP